MIIKNIKYHELNYPQKLECQTSKVKIYQKSLGFINSYWDLFFAPCELERKLDSYKNELLLKHYPIGKN